MKKILLVLCAIILAELGYAQHTLILNPASDCYVETYGGGVGKNSFLKFDITSIPPGAVLTATKLRVFVSNVSPSWDGDLGIVHYSNQTWVEGDSTNVLWQLTYLADTITQLAGFGTLPGWAETVDINPFLNIDYQASTTFFSVLLKDLDDPTFAPNMSSVSINDNDSMMIGNIFNDNIVFRPREWVNAPPQLVIDYGIPPTVSPVTPVSPVCENSSVTMSISATGDLPLTYQWQFNGVDIPGANASSYAIASAQLTDAGDYTCIVTNAYGSDTSGVLNLVVNANPSLTVTGTNVTCNGFCDGTATANVSGGGAPYTYIWSTGAMGPAITGLCPGVYSPTVIDANGCSATGSVTITEPAVLVVSVLSQSSLLCNGDCNGSATLSVSGGTAPYSYTWSNGATGNPGTGLCAGVSCCTITDSQSCTVTICVTITQPAAITVNETHTNVSCNGLCDGTATMNVSGGTPGYICQWDANTGSQTTFTAINLCAGTYYATITDSNGCTSTGSVTITEPSAISVSETHTDVTCNGLCDGIITLSVSGGTAPYTYIWSNGSIGNPITGLCAGTYCCTITDQNGCTATTCVVITEPDVLSIAFTSQTNVSCNGLCDGTVTVLATGGTTPYTFLWSNGSTSPIATNLCTGVYCVTVSDAENCTIAACVTITEPAQMTGIISSTDDHGTGDGTATIIVSGGTGSYTYDWSPNGFTGDGTDTYSDLIAGFYSVIVTDANLCTLVDTVEVMLNVGINIKKSDFSYSLFPNPVRENINLKISTDRTENISLTVFNSVGNEILTKEIQLNSGENIQSINLDQVTSGVYYIRLQRLNNSSYLKFIKVE